VETCNVLSGCVPGQDPCVGQHCNEVLDRCEECADGLSCDDGNWCTVNDVCVGTVCQGGAPRDCSDGIACTRDLCVNGACNNSVDPAVCDDGDPCTFDQCNPTSGSCTHENLWSPVDTCAKVGCPALLSVPTEPVFVNNDDDNGNGWPDYLDAGQIGMADNELAIIGCNIDACIPLPGCVREASDYEMTTTVMEFGSPQYPTFDLFSNPDIGCSSAVDARRYIDVAREHSQNNPR